MKKKSIKVLLGLTLFLSIVIFTILFVVFFKNSQPQNESKEKPFETIRSFVTSMYDIDHEEYERLMEYEMEYSQTPTSDQTEMIDWMYQTYESFMTRECFENALKSGVIIQGFRMYATNDYTPAEVIDIKITEEAEWYTYSATVRTQTGESTIQGNVFFSSIEPDKISKIVR